MINFNDVTEGEDASLAARHAIDELHKGQQRLVFPCARYHFWPEWAGERYLFVSNNDEGLKRIAFDLTGLLDVEIDGQGSEFIFHGGIVPFVFERCARISVKNLSIDWARPFHTEAEIIASDEHGVEVYIDHAYPFEVKNERLIFKDEIGQPLGWGIGNILEFDPHRRETAFMAPDNFGIGQQYIARDLGNRHVRLEGKFQTPHPKAGHVLAISSSRRDYPAIVLTRCEDVTLSDVAIHHAGGMGVIAQRCKNMTLRRVMVAPPEGRLISATADATHFVNCSGHVRVLDCQFNNQLDDPLNCHGVYGQVIGQPSSHQLDLKIVHRQQLGFELADVGNTIELIHGQSMVTYHKNTVTASAQLNREITRLTFAEPLPNHVTIGDAATDISATCDLTIKGTTASGNRARGFLVSTPGRILIEDNVLHTPGAAILIEGDANYWYESGAVRDVVIRNNRFDNCNYGVWGKAAIQITPGVGEQVPGDARFHRNIRIENNTFVAFDPRLLFTRRVDGLSFTGNKIITSAAYPILRPDGPKFDIDHCSEIDLEGNTDAPPSAVASQLEPQLSSWVRRKTGDRTGVPAVTAH